MLKIESVEPLNVNTAKQKTVADLKNHINRLNQQLSNIHTLPPENIETLGTILNWGEVLITDNQTHSHLYSGATVNESNGNEEDQLIKELDEVADCLSDNLPNSVIKIINDYLDHSKASLRNSQNQNPTRIIPIVNLDLEFFDQYPGLFRDPAVVEVWNEIDKKFDSSEEIIKGLTGVIIQAIGCLKIKKSNLCLTREKISILEKNITRFKKISLGLQKIHDELLIEIGSFSPEFTDFLKSCSEMSKIAFNTMSNSETLTKKIQATKEDKMLYHPLANTDLQDIMHTISHFARNGEKEDLVLARALKYHFTKVDPQCHYWKWTAAIVNSMFKTNYTRRSLKQNLKENNKSST